MSILRKVIPQEQLSFLLNNNLLNISAGWIYVILDLGQKLVEQKTWDCFHEAAGIHVFDFDDQHGNIKGLKCRKLNTTVAEAAWCIRPCKENMYITHGIDYQPELVRQISEPSILVACTSWYV